MAPDGRAAPPGGPASGTGPTDVDPARSLTSAFVQLTDCLDRGAEVDGIFALLPRLCTEQLGVGDAAMLVLDGDAARLAAAVGDVAQRFALLELRSRQGPATDCLDSGSVRGSDDLLKEDDHWPLLREAARLTGTRSVYALPLLRGGTAAGALLLVGREPGGLDQGQRDVATALLALAGRVLEHKAALQQALQVTEQLERALSSRLVIEQAKGVLSERKKVPMEVVFSGLRRYSRERNLKLAELARAVVRGDVDVEVDRRRRARDAESPPAERSRRASD